MIVGVVRGTVLLTISGEFSSFVVRRTIPLTTFQLHLSFVAYYINKNSG